MRSAYLHIVWRALYERSKFSTHVSIFSPSRLAGEEEIRWFGLDFRGRGQLWRTIEPFRFPHVVKAYAKRNCMTHYWRIALDRTSCSPHFYVSGLYQFSFASFWMHQLPPEVIQWACMCPELHRRISWPLHTRRMWFQTHLIGEPVGTLVDANGGVLTGREPGYCQVAKLLRRPKWFSTYEY